VLFPWNAFEGASPAAQCAIPVFDGLLPEPHNRQVQQLLFTMAHWHGLAKLRMHTDLTLDVMDRITVMLGKKLRLFQQETCQAFQTRELKRERDARIRREHKKSATMRGNSSPVRDSITRTFLPRDLTASGEPVFGVPCRGAISAHQHFPIPANIAFGW
jgi:hypothetical protein